MANPLSGLVPGIFRGAHAKVRQPVQAPREPKPVPVEKLELKAEQAAQIQEMIHTPGWRLFEAIVQAKAQAAINQLTNDLDPLTQPKEVLKAQVHAQEIKKLLALPALLIREGLEAETELAKGKEPHG